MISQQESNFKQSKFVQRDWVTTDGFIDILHLHTTSLEQTVWSLSFYQIARLKCI